MITERLKTVKQQKEMENQKDKREAISDEAEKAKDEIGYEPYIKALTKTIVNVTLRSQ